MVSLFAYLLATLPFMGSPIIPSFIDTRYKFIEARFVINIFIYTTWYKIMVTFYTFQ